ncbi:50S ribosomal protein L13 [Candidatus Peregrinibacteria bacterium]|nr:50S ribosomal protein L13 [Candidatus Peregrinibacteria bacterium]
MQKTFVAKHRPGSQRRWYLVDAGGKILGHIAPAIANTLRGKNKPEFTPHVDTGDYVVVTNAEKIMLTGSKEKQKEYITHSGYLGHIKRVPFETVRAKNPARIIEEAVAGMIPRNKMKKFIMARLMVYKGPEHPHAGQNPVSLKI